MSTLNDKSLSTARNNHRLMLQGVANVGLESLANVADVDKSSISRLGGDAKLGWEALANMLAHMGMKVVSADAICIKKDDYISLVNLSDRGLDHIRQEIENSNNDCCS